MSKLSSWGQSLRIKLREVDPEFSRIIIEFWIDIVEVELESEEIIQLLESANGINEIADGLIEKEITRQLEFCL